MLLLRSIAFPLDEPGTTPGRHACLLIGPITIARILGRQGEQDRRCTLRAEEPEREEGARKGRRSQKGEGMTDAEPDLPGFGGGGGGTGLSDHAFHDYVFT